MTRVRACPDGPLLVDGGDGPLEVVTEDGEVHTSTRPVCAVCRCGSTARAPWCDGSHKLLAQRRRARRAEARAEARAAAE